MFMIEEHPKCLLQYCKDMYDTPEEWTDVIIELLNRKSGLNEQDDNYLLYTEVNFITY